MKKTPFDLAIPVDDISSCVSCGLCLPHCPTYRATQEESASPRGRIALMRQAQRDSSIDDAFVGFMDTCIQCRGCETACPAAVPFGSMMEKTREALATQTSYQPRWRRFGYSFLGKPRLLRLGSIGLAVLQRLRMVPRRLPLPKLPFARKALIDSGSDVWLYTGCIMDAWMRETHLAAQRVIESTGAGVKFPLKGASCCGALHVHAGLAPEARALAKKTMASFPGEAPILVDSAGCGAQLKAYGELVGTEEAEVFSRRVMDVHEWLAERLEQLPTTQEPRPKVVVQDPCHLRHVQKAHESVHQVLEEYVDLIHLNDDGLCCGAGGAYATFHPEVAKEVRERKLSLIRSVEAEEVASANPGCLLHLQAGGVRVRHPLEIIDGLLTRES